MTHGLLMIIQIVVEEASHQYKKALCKVCSNKVIDISNMGVSALCPHQGLKGHKRALARLSSPSTVFFKPVCKNSKVAPSVHVSMRAEQTTGVTSSSQSSGEVSLLLAPSELKIKSLDAEIRWTAKIVLSHVSYRSTDNLKQLFMTMFDDSSIAKEFTFSRTKASYFVHYGLAPCFHKDLLKSIKESPFHSVCFDESLNKVSQSWHMDIMLRIWDVNKCEAVTRYLTSKFLLNPSAENLRDVLIDALPLIDLKQISLSMDGPNVNWLVLNLINAYRLKHGQSSLFDCGACPLHVVHGAFKTEFNTVDWNIEKY